MRGKALLNLIIAAVTGLAATGIAVAVAGIGVTAVSAAESEMCRPDGLYRTPNVATTYCAAYDTNGREMLGTGHGRRVIGYFASWRHGTNNQPSYLVSDIPRGRK